jgi:F-type H+-transporting ATPase subunit b
MSVPAKRTFTRARLVLAGCLFAICALVTGLALAQEHGDTPSRAPSGHAPTATAHGGAAAEPGHGESAGGQSGEHRAAPAGHDEHAEHGGAEHAEHANGGHHGPEPINWTDIWDKRRPAMIALVINFGVLLTLYYMLGKKPITAALKQRRVTIGKEIDEAQALLAEAKERAKKYQADLKNADVDAATAKTALIAAGKGEVEHILLEAQERAERMKRDADRLVEQERKQVHLDLLHETVDLAVEEAARILEKSVTADDHARLAQDLLAELARRPAAKPATPAGGSVRPGSTGGAT